MPFLQHDFRLEVLKSLVEAGSERYKENIRINSLLEDKAQKTAGFAGVFLAAALAFIKVDTLAAWPFNRLRILIPLGVAVALLVCCIAFCLAVMWVQSIAGPPTFQALNQLRLNLWAITGRLEPYEEGYWGDRAELWQNVINDQSSVIDSKAQKLQLAQLTLASAMFVVAILLFCLIGPIIFSHLHGVTK